MSTPIDSSADHLNLLIRMRDTIQEAVEDEECPPRDRASLTRRLQDISKEIVFLEERKWAEGNNSGPCPALAEHSNLLKTIRVHIRDTVFSGVCPPRDLAALTRRLQDISKEITAIDERQRLEGGTNGSAGKTKGKGKYNPDDA